MTERGNRLGVIGGGQLGQMVAEAAVPLGYGVVMLDPSPEPPAARFGARHIQGALHDIDGINLLAAQADVLTWEIEHIPADYLIELQEQGAVVESSPRTLSIIQDKLTQKQHLQEWGIPVGPFSTPENVKELGGGPYIVKKRRGGFDGRGNLETAHINQQHLEGHFGSEPVYVEKKLDFEMELSVVAARDRQGQTATYPVVQTKHSKNICHTVLAPAPVEPKIAEDAVDIAHATLDKLEGAGVFAIELFVVDGLVKVNEIAPRVHNSGHYTIEACVTSQFEQHVRAVMGNPLGSTAMRAPAAVMINMLGTDIGDMNYIGRDEILAIPDTHPHYYGKSRRDQRKIGHITALGATIDEAWIRARQAHGYLEV